jgi:hypothetical protein
MASNVLDDILTKGKTKAIAKTKAKGKAAADVADVPQTRKQPGGPDNPEGSIRFTLHIPFGLVDRIRRVAYYVPGETIAAIAERGIRGEVEKMEAKRGPFGDVPGGKLKGGRPIRMEKVKR